MVTSTRDKKYKWKVFSICMQMLVNLFVSLVTMENTRNTCITLG